MDDTVAMQDTHERAANGPATKEAPAAAAAAAVTDAASPPPAVAQPHEAQPQPLLQAHLNAQQAGADQLAAALAGSKQAASPRSPQPTPGHQLAFDASSTASDGSADASKQHGPPRRNYSSVDVDVAKQAAMSALAGLDMTTTKANLDASKAAAATARANGEVPAHVRKSNLRSVSCRQLGSGTTPGGVGKTVAFDEAALGGAAGLAKAARPEGAATKSVQWRAGTAAGDGAPRRTTRAPASRCISLPHVLQGRAGMASRLAATYAQDAALQQQLLLNGGAAGFAGGGGGLAQLQAGAMPQVDVLSMYQLQQAAASGAGAGGQLLGQRSFGANTVLASVDDSMLQLRSGGMVLAAGPQQQQQQQLQLQQQQHLAAGSWAGAGVAAQQQQQQQRVTWAPGTAQVAGVAAAGPSAGLANQQLLAQLQGGGQGPAGGEGMWQLQAPTGSAAMQQVAGGSRPQALLVGTANAPGLGAGLPGLQASSGLLSPHLQAAPGGVGGALAGGGGGGPGSSAAAATFAALLEQYQQQSWSLLAAAQGETGIREQLLTELVLQLTMLHTLSGVLQSSLSPPDALSDFSYLGSAARRHIATFSRLSQAGNTAVQLLAMIAPLACRHLGTTELLEAAFLVLDTLALASRDVAAVVGQQRLEALGNLALQLPVEVLLQQQTAGLAWINSMAAAVNRNKQVLESFAGGEQPAATQPMVLAAGGPLLQGAGGVSAGGVALPLGVPMAASRPMMLSPTAAGSAPALSPTNKTPLATYFEEMSPAGAAAAPGGPGAAPVAPGLAGVGGGLGGLACAPPGLAPDTLAGMGLAGQAAGTPDHTAVLAGLSHMSLGQVPAAAAAAAPAGQAGGVGVPGGGLLGGGLPLFGGAGLHAPDGGAAANAAAGGGQQAGASAGHMVGV